MESIKLLNVEKKDNTVIYDFFFSQGLSKYFTGSKFIIHYPISVKNVPDSILAIPFVSNIIHLSWITDAELLIPVLDKDFYDCLPNLKSAFKKMFPEASFSGILKVEKIEHNISKSPKKSGMFYSGGVDSFQTLISHYKEKIDLVSIWGSDIQYDNEKGWNVLNHSNEASILPFKLKLLSIHSSFRDIYDEKKLYKEFYNQLKDSWWHGLQHGIGLLGHAAPLAYTFNYSHFYIASTHSFHDLNVRCSSNPSTDNCVKFCGCQVVHDGFEFKRQDKIKNLLEFSKNNPNLPINLHVCWKTQTGENCCSCEKCARTVYALLIEGGDPSIFGFNNYKNAINGFQRKTCLIYLNKHPHLFHAWFDIADRAKEKKKDLIKNENWHQIKWLLKLNRNKPGTQKLCFIKSRVLIHKVFDKLSNLKKKFLFSKTLKSLIRNGGEKAVFLIGTPTHCNIGDAAIARAELDFLNDIGLVPVEITVDEWKKYKKIISKFTENKLVLLHGGGNFGNLWPYEEAIREDILNSTKAKHFIILPQTFFVTKTTNAEYYSSLQRVYDNKKISIFAREKFSFERIQELFPNAKSYLVPDIVLFEKNRNKILSNSNFKSKVLLVLRNDREGLLHFDDVQIIKECLLENNLEYETTEMLHDSPSISKLDRNKIINQKLDLFASSKLIITDRLHAMIFAYLCDVPCIVLHNNNYKIDGVYKWLGEKSNIYLLDTLSNLKSCIKRALSERESLCFDDDLFDCLKNEILAEKENAEC